MEINFEDAKAHVDEESGRSQSLNEHLHNVAKLTSEYAAAFKCSVSGYYAGLYHDIGKWSVEFKERLEGGKSVDHSSLGAYLMFCRRRLAEAIVIAAHHSGLLDMDFGKGSSTASTFCSRLQKIKNTVDMSPYLAVLGDPMDEKDEPFLSDKMDTMEWFIAIHFLFSCLVDADYTDTSRFFRTEKEFCSLDFKVACDRILERAERYLRSAGGNRLNILRNGMLEECINKGNWEQGIYTLTIPTGGGKTFSSLAFAASHARKHPNIKRIIYVIPYLSIIEQNAAVVREIVGSEYVLEHHSVSPVYADDESNSEENSRLLLATENWDIPIIMTTNEQFFESLFSNRASKSRKIHNIANSVIIFDEAQMLPLKYLTLFFSAIRELVDNKRYGITAILCTATQPPLEKFIGRQPVELVSSNLSSDKIFCRFHIENIGDIKDIPLFCEKIASDKQVLVVVNTKASAKEIYENLPEEGRFYLTTNLTPFSRKKILSDIRKCLATGKACRVVSTSLIEAGVDVDFPVVYREINGLDSIIQSGGRCNREGKRTADESTVYVFNLGKMRNKGDYARKISSLKAVARYNNDLLDVNTIREYYETYYRDSITNEGCELFSKNIFALQFRTIGEKIRIIDNEEIGIFIPQNYEAERLLNEILAYGGSRRTFRKTMEYTVRCPASIAEELVKSGYVKKLGDILFVLCEKQLYNELIGLDLPNKDIENDYIF